VIRLKVLMINTGVLPLPPETAAGAEYHVYHLANHLAKHSVEVHLVSEIRSGSYFEPSIGIHSFRFKHPPLRRFSGWLITHAIGGFHSFIKFLEVANKVEPDIIHLHGRLAPRLISMIKKRTPLIYTVHDQSPYTATVRGFERLIRKAAYLLQEYRTARKVHHVIAVSKHIYRELTEWVGIPKEKVSLIPNGVDTEYFRPSESKKPYIIFVGRLTKRKGVDMLVEAFAEVVRTFPEIRLIIVGDGEEKTNIINMARKLDIFNRILLLSNIPITILRKLYAEAMIFVLPSRGEGLPLSLLEAMSSQCAVIASKVSGIIDVVKDGETGMLVEPDNKKQLVNALRILLEDRNLARKMSEKAREYVVKEYSWNRIAEKTIRVYQKVHQEVK